MILLRIYNKISKIHYTGVQDFFKGALLETFRSFDKSYNLVELINNQRIQLYLTKTFV